MAAHHGGNPLPSGRFGLAPGRQPGRSAPCRLAGLSFLQSPVCENSGPFCPPKPPFVTSNHSKTPENQALDAMTGGAFSAPTAGERAARVRQWLAGAPSLEQLQDVQRELAGRDKGAARLVRERLDEIKRGKLGEAMAAEWAGKAEALLASTRLNIADAMAWQRDAAKAGAPLGREPLAALKTRLAERIKGIEDLQHRVQVQREAAVLLAQRIEVLSTKSWRDALAATESLRSDVPAWHAAAQALADDANWPSVDGRFPPLLEASRSQLQAVWDAFQSALAQAEAAQADATAPLPPVPVWADELRAARGVPVEPAPVAAAAKPRVDPALRARATEAVGQALAKLEAEIEQGHGKSSAGAAAALRAALKEHGRLVDAKLENQAHAALAAAGELEGWQRWRADQLRQALVARAEALFETVPAAPRKARAATRPPEAADAADAADAAVTTDTVQPESEPASASESPAEAGPESTPDAAPVRRPRYGGRKMQEQLRALREEWKQTDQGGPPNHGLWRRFDEACNQAYTVVEEWLAKLKAEAAEHRASRLALIEELKAWAADNPSAKDDDWKGFARVLAQFESRWREAGHLGDKAFAELQPQWREAMALAHGPLSAVQAQSQARREAMIEEARLLGAAPQLRIDAVRALQQRWQAEAQAVPMERRQEQKLWDAFRAPIDEAFNRKTQERERAQAAVSERDRAVLEASRALSNANASGDAQQIRAAMAQLEAALRGAAPPASAPAASTEQKVPPEQVESAGAATETVANEVDTASASPAAAPDAAPAAGPAEASAPAAAPAPAPKRVVAMRGDDRPGQKRVEAAPAGRGGKFDDRRGPGRGSDRGPGRGPERGDFRDRGERGGRFGERGDDAAGAGPRLGDAAFRAQRDAMEQAQLALRKLAAQAHGEAVAQLMAAWERRAADQVPSVSELGKAVSPALRGRWAQALAQAPQGDAAEALLRLEIGAEQPTPAEQLAQRRAMQLQLLTRRHDAPPAQTWGEDTARVLASAYEPAAGRRLQAVLKHLLRR